MAITAAPASVQPTQEAIPMETAINRLQSGDV
jgi:hypothetical protein